MNWLRFYGSASKQAIHGTQRPIRGATRVIAVSSAKGGVGKSTLTVNLASSFVSEKKKVGILDADVFGPSIPSLLNLWQKPDVDSEGRLIPLVNHGLYSMSMGYLIPKESPIAWRGLMVTKALNTLIHNVAWPNLDVLFVDMPPGTGDVQLTIAQQIKLDGVVFISTPQELALLDTNRGIELFNKMNVPTAGIVFNMSYYLCPECKSKKYIFGDKDLQSVASSLKQNYLGEIPIEPELSKQSDKGIPYVLTNQNSESYKAYHQIKSNLFKFLNM